MAESFIFYETFAKQLKLLDKDLRYKFYEAIIEYGLYATEPDFTGLEACAWLPIQEAISNAKSRRTKNITDGKKGGRPEIPQDIKNSIGKDLENGLTQKEIAEKYEISQQTVSNIKKEVFSTKYQKPQGDTKNLNVDVNVNGNVDVNGDDIIPPDCPGGDNTLPAQSTSPPAEALRLAELLYTLHKQLDPGFNKSAKHIHSWADDIDKLHRIDNRSWADTEAVIRWIKTAGNFWAANIISGAKLRERFSQVFLQMQSNRTTSPPIEQADANYDFSKALEAMQGWG